MTPGDRRQFRSYHKTFRGGSHEESGKPCQDFSYEYRSNSMAIVSVADGHGSDRYVRSDRGSRFAAEESVWTIRDYVDSVHGIPEDRDRFLDAVVRTIVARWSGKVKADIEGDQLTSLEQEMAGERADGPAEKLYGTTLLVACLTRDFAFALQIGDGCFTVHRDGDVIMPMPEDPDCTGNRTSSICDSEAIGRFRSVWFDKVPEAITISTDGLYTTFRSDGEFMAYCDRIVDLCVRMSLTDAVEPNLQKRARSGHQDDVSVAVVGFRDADIKGWRGRRRHGTV